MSLKIALGISATAIAGGVLFISSGVFDVSATGKHWGITTNLLELVRERAVHVRSKDIEVPPLENTEMIANGAKNYAAMCAQCHLAPGMEATELSLGMYPQPPVFHQSDEHASHDAAATFWAIKHGFKMTGMPAWGDFHTDQELWELVAFLQQVEGMSERQYKALVGEGGHSHADEHS